MCGPQAYTICAGLAVLRCLCHADTQPLAQTKLCCAASGTLAAKKKHSVRPVTNSCRVRASKKKARLELSLSLETAVSTSLLFGGLEAAVAELGGSVDELELDLLQGVAAGLGDQRATQGDSALLGAWDTTLYQKHTVTTQKVSAESFQMPKSVERRL